MIGNEEALKILTYLDGWNIKTTNGEIIYIHDVSDLSDTEIKEIFNDSNKKVHIEELDFFFEDALSDSLIFTNQKIKNNDKINHDFLKAVYKLTASKIWNKYNIHVETDETESIFTRSYGGILYSDAMKKLQRFRKNMLYGLSD
jgi:hypothetical protein